MEPTDYEQGQVQEAVRGAVVRAARRSSRSPRAQGVTALVTAGEPVNVFPGTPDDYHCQCRWCLPSLGHLKKPDGQYAKPQDQLYSRLARRAYYSPRELGEVDPETGKKEGTHIAKTPLHIARWAVQQYSSPGDWVLDPTIGAGTTAVEAMTQGRNAAGMEIEFGDILQANLRVAKELAAARDMTVHARYRLGDARGIRSFLDELLMKYGIEFQLVVNNPPYSGDESYPTAKKGRMGPDYRDEERQFRYRSDLPNLAFLRENSEYWESIRQIYSACVDRLRSGGHFVVGTKDQVRERQIQNLHAGYAEVLSSLGLTHVGTAFLQHYPPTQSMSTLSKRHGYSFPMPKYQTITVFRKV